VAAEVADSAELLHEEVPEHEEVEHDSSNSKLPEQTIGAMSEPAETAAEVADTAETLDNGQVCTRLPSEEFARLTERAGPDLRSESTFGRGSLVRSNTRRWTVLRGPGRLHRG
jgi:hypothetical protein